MSRLRADCFNDDPEALYNCFSMNPFVSTVAKYLQFFLVHLYTNTFNALKIYKNKHILLLFCGRLMFESNCCG
jgi:hypothetical protein